jgi:hypothetical protein
MAHVGWPPWQLPVVPSGHGKGHVVAELGQAHAQPVVKCPAAFPVSSPAMMPEELHAATGAEPRMTTLAAQSFALMGSRSFAEVMLRTCDGSRVSVTKKDSAASARAPDATGERRVRPVAKERGGGRARIPAATECAEDDDALRLALLDENARREASTMLVEQVQRERRVTGLSRGIGSTQ